MICRKVAAPRHIQRTRALQKHASLVQAEFAPQKEEKQRDQRHKPNTAHLYQDQQNDLPKKRLLHRSIVNHQARYTGGTGCSKQTVKGGGPCAVGGGNRQAEQQGTY